MEDDSSVSSAKNHLQRELLLWISLPFLINKESYFSAKKNW